ncbi:uncharacterized protein N7483_009868 [Penicillium malachiteum]|uniref:uncharacterized protein n=1 Tax=Penicillium malachiteum TaxID=1324776 RepID=UPI0025475E2C|nr:uncharacterized protein N7483_009868 [Penicillium malachiteum]KAJ5721934.1 hypothetical protein N7483_009868 [Penicillium malachiteum]
MSVRIAIIGAGPVGLTLARLLHNLTKRNLEVVVFESEPSRYARQQGGTLDLHPDTGLAAIKEAGLWDEFKKHVRYDGEALIICDKKLVKYISLTAKDETSSAGRPEIDRSSLREMLLDSVPPEMIRWGCHLREIDENRNLIFDHGIESGFDLVVGADGAWSKIRRYLSDQKPDYSGISGYIFHIPNAKETAPAAYKLTNRGSVFSFSDGRSIMSQYISDGSLYINAWCQLPENWREILPHDVNDTEAIKKLVLEQFHDWHPDLVNFIKSAEQPSSASLYMLPVGWRWDHRPGVTLIGDAAHLMTPFAGEGVNVGMQDALMLSRAVGKALDSPNPAVQLNPELVDFEEDLFVRAERTTSLTKDMMHWMMFADGSPRTVIDKYILRILTFHDKGILDYLRYPLLMASLKSWFFLYRLWH